MKKYRKRPLVIEAAQWDGIFLGGKMPEEVLKGASWGRQVWIDDNLGGPIFIGTLEGQMKCNLGDWIIKGIKGEFYPIKNEIFLESYELADPATPLERMRANVDTFKVVGGKIVTFCPFHEETTPSFCIDLRNESYNCFGCGASGKPNEL